MVLLASQIILLLSIAYQDFKSRAISWFLLPVLFIVGVLSNLENIEFVSLEWLKSLGFFVAQLGLVYLYFALRMRSFNFKFADGLIGWGDILFLIAIIPFFDFKQYVLVYSLSLVFSLLSHLVAVLIKKDAFKAIPLLGWMGIFFIGVFIFDFLS